MAEGKEWSHKMFGCFDDCGLCIMTYLCPCVTYGRAMAAMGENCCLCGLCMFVDPIGFAGQIWLRTMIRQKAGIQGSLTNDILCTACCGFCALVQEAQELKEMGLYGTQGGAAMARD